MQECLGAQWQRQVTERRLDKIRADFEECRGFVYPGATLAALNPDGTFRWQGPGDPEANQKLTLCLKQKGYRITP
jgi:hypothetical protein